MDLELEGRVAVVTGASRGIGKATAEALAAEGVQVAIVARNQHDLNIAAEELARRTGSRLLPIVADTRDQTAVNSMAARVASELGAIGILVNCAATPNASVARVGWQALSSDDLNSQIDVKVMGYIRCIQAVAPYMIESGWGRIINIAGGAARHTGSTIGSIRNAGVVAMSKNFADELGPAGINVVAVHPGVIATEASSARTAALAEKMSIPEAEARRRIFEHNHLRRTIMAGDVANVITFLASPKAVGITGDVVSTGGGTERAIFY